MSKDQQIGKAAMNMTSNIYMNSTTKFIGLNAINPNLKNIDQLKQKALGGFLHTNQKSKNQDLNKSPTNNEGSASRIVPTKMSQLGSSVLFQGLDSPQNKNRVLSGNRNSFSRIQANKPQTPKDKSTQQKKKPQHIQRSHGRNLIKNDSSQVSVTNYKINNSTNNETESKNIVVQQFQKNHTQMKDDFSVKNKTQNKRDGELTDRSQPPQSKKSGGYVYRPLGGNKKEEQIEQQKKPQPVRPSYTRKNNQIQQPKVEQKKDEPKKQQTNILKKQLSPLIIQNNKPSLPSKKSPENNQSSNQSGYVYRPPQKKSQKSIVFQQQTQKNVQSTGGIKKIQRKSQETVISKPDPVVNKIISPKNNESANKFQRKSNSITKNQNSKEQIIQLIQPKNQSANKRNRINQQLNLEVNVDTNYFKLEIKGGSTQRSHERQRSLTDRQKNKPSSVNAKINNKNQTVNNNNNKSQTKVEGSNLGNNSNANVKPAYQYKKPLANNQSQQQIQNTNKVVTNSNTSSNAGINSEIKKQITSGYQYKKPLANQSQTNQQKQVGSIPVQRYPSSRLSKQQQEKPTQQIVTTNNNSLQKKPAYQYKKPLVNQSQTIQQKQAVSVQNQKKYPSSRLSKQSQEKPSQQIVVPSSIKNNSQQKKSVYQYKKPLVNQHQTIQQKQTVPIPVQNQRKYPPSRLSKQTQEKPIQEIVAPSVTNNNSQQTKPVYQYKKPPVKTNDNIISQSLAENKSNNNTNNKVEPSPSISPEKVYQSVSYRTKTYLNTKVEDGQKQPDEIIKKQVTPPKKPTISYANRPKTKEELLQGVTVVKAQTTKIENQPIKQNKINKIQRRTPQKINDRNNNQVTLNSTEISTVLQNNKKITIPTSSYTKSKTKQELLQVVKPVQNINVQKPTEQKVTSPKSKTDAPSSVNNSQSGYVYRFPKKSQKFTKPISNDQSTTVANQSKFSELPVFKKIQQNKSTIEEVSSSNKTNQSKIEIKKPTYKYGQQANIEKIQQEKKLQQPLKKIQQIKAVSLSIQEKKQEIVAKPIKSVYGKKQPITTAPITVVETNNDKKIQSSELLSKGQEKPKVITKQPIKIQIQNLPQKLIKRPNALFCIIKMMYANNMKNCFKKIQKKSLQIKNKHTKVASALVTSILAFSKNLQKKLLNSALSQFKKKVFSQFNKQVQAKKQEQMNQLKLKSQETLLIVIESLFKSKLRKSFDTLIRNTLWKKSIFISCQSFNKIITQKEHDIQILAFKKLKLYNSITKANVEDVLNIFKTSNGKNLKDMLHKLFSAAYPIKNLKTMSRPGSERSISISRVSVSPIIPVKGALSNSPSQKSITNRSVKGPSNNIKEKIQKLQKQISQKTTNHERQIKELFIKKQNIRKDIKKSNTQYQQKKGQNKQIKQLFQKSQGKDFEQVEDTFNNQNFQRLESLSELYTNLYRIEKDQVDLNQIKENLPKNEGINEKGNALLREWAEIRRNLTLKNNINKYEGVQPKEYKAVKSLMQEQQVAQKLLRSYIRQRYLWEWVRKTANSIVY